MTKDGDQIRRVGELVFSETDVEWKPDDDQPFDIKLNLEFEQETRDFIGIWDIREAGAELVGGKRKKSGYSAANKFVEVNLTEVQRYVDKAQLVSSEYVIRIAVRASLYHELTHRVQHKFRGQGWLDRAITLREVHADLISGYWLANSFEPAFLKVIGPLAFAKVPTQEGSGYPFGCVRKTAYLAGLSMGLKMKYEYQDIRVSESTRWGLFTQSLANAREIIKHGSKPCDLRKLNYTQSLTDLCETCPNKDEAAIKLGEMQARLTRITRKPIRRAASKVLEELGTEKACSPDVESTIPDGH